MPRPVESSIVTKCGLVIDVVSQARQPLAFAEIVARSGLVKGSCHRILSVLQGEEMISYDRVSRTYFTGPRLKRWARSSWQRTDISDVSAVVMERLSDSTGKNVSLSILDDQYILYLRVTDHESFRFAPRAGDRAPLHCTAAGKVFLAHMSERRRTETLSVLKLDKFTEFTKTNLADLETDVAAALVQGYAMANMEEYLHVIGMAAPILNVQGQVTACLSLWTPTDKGTAADMEQLAPMLQRAVADISAELGWEGRGQDTA